MLMVVYVACMQLGVHTPRASACGKMVLMQKDIVFRVSTRLLLLCAIFFCAGVPPIAFAKVYISEVAWMGTDENANAEWIELFNDGPAQSLTGWTLNALDGQPAIVLSGTVGASGYALLERTSDATVSEVTALLVYTGALGNAGEVLELRDESGALVDRVEGGVDWELGGDNGTKDTLQRAGAQATGAWMTAPATPGRGGGVATTDAADTEQTEARGDQKTVATAKVPIPQVPKVKLEPALTIDVGDDIVATIGAPIRLTAHGYSETGRELVLTDVVWAFGDGAQGAGRTIEHGYEHVGEYRVVAVGTRSGFRTDIQARDSVLVRVVRPALTISAVDHAYIEVSNTGDDELDLSKYWLVVGEDHFRLPAHTYLLPQARVRFPSSVTALTPREDVGVGIFSPDRTLVASYGVAMSPTTVTLPTQPARALSKVTRSEQVPDSEDVAVVNDVPVVEYSAFKTPEFAGAEIEQAAEAYLALEKSGIIGDENGNILWWIVGLIAATFLAVLIALLVRREQEEIVRGYTLEEDV